jgi:predicted transcriptional regulator
MSDLEDLQRQRKEADQRLRRAIDDFDIVAARETLKEITRLKVQIDQLKSSS